jgi:hypothetical protein
MPYVALPLSTLRVPSNPYKAAAVVFLWWPIFVVFASMNMTQIGNSVVGSVVIYVIYVIDRPRPVVKRPRNPVRFQLDTKNAATEIPRASRRNKALFSGVSVIPLVILPFATKHCYGPICPNKLT